MAHREAQSAAETKCGVMASALSGMRQQLDALQVSFDAEAARADAAVAHAAAAAACANAAEKRAAAAEAKVARMEEAEVQGAVSFILAPAEVMAAAAKKRATEWAVALDMLHVDAV